MSSMSFDRVPSESVTGFASMVRTRFISMSALLGLVVVGTSSVTEGGGRLSAAQRHQSIAGLAVEVLRGSFSSPDGFAIFATAAQNDARKLSALSGGAFFHSFPFSASSARASHSAAIARSAPATNRLTASAAH